MFSVCSHLGGGSGPGGVRSGGGQVQLAGGGQVQPGGSGPGGGGQVQPGGGQVQLAGGGGQVQLAGGGQVQPGGVRSSWRGGVSGPAVGVSSSWPGGGQVQPGGVRILRPLAGGMPLAFTQEDFLVFMQFSGKIGQMIG